MQMPEWKITKYNPEDETYLCTDGRVRTAECLYNIIRLYDQMFLFDMERLQIGFLNTVEIDNDHYRGVRFGRNF